MTNRQKSLELRSNILQEVLRIKQELDNSAHPSGLDIGLASVLEELSNLLKSKERIERETLKRYAYSVFRLTTDDGPFSNSHVGQELLKLSTDIHNLSHEQ